MSAKTKSQITFESLRAMFYLRILFSAQLSNVISVTNKSKLIVYCKISVSYFRLVFGLLCSLLAMYVKGWRSQYALLGAISDTGVYVNIDTYKKAIELNNIKIFQYTGAINFASAGSFKRTLYKTIGEIRPHITEVNGNDGDSVLKKLEPHAVIIDFSCVSNIDVAACKVFAEIQTDLLLSNTVLYLCGLNDRLFDTVKHSETLSIGKFSIFPTVHDAVLYFQSSAADNV